MLTRSNINSAHSDNDGLPDGYEVNTLGTNPLYSDSDDNGTLDDQEDFDDDSLSNYNEYLHGTDPFKTDTDGDGLSDYTEATTFYGTQHTDPLDEDTDGDTLSDGDDVALGFSPLLQDTDGNGTLDCDEIIEQTLDLERIDESLFSDNYTGTHMEFLDGNLFGSLSYINSQELQYGLSHQSAKLNGSTNVNTKYFAIGGVSYGYGVSSGTKAVEFTANYQSKSDFLSSIISAAALVNINISNLDVTSGDNVIDIATQFGIWLEGDMITQKINFKRTTLFITDNEEYRGFLLFGNYRLEGPFWHNDILKQNELSVSVLQFLGE